MAGKRVNMRDVREMIRRMKLGQRERGIARDLKIARKTVKAYRQVAEAKGWLQAEELPSVEVMETALRQERASPRSCGVPLIMEPYRVLVERWQEQGVTAGAMFARLQTEHGYRGSYSSVYRAVKAVCPRSPEGYVRVETLPGEEAQVDFGYAGRLFDPQRQSLRKTWVFVMTLSFSRHLYVEFVFDQTVASFVGCHTRALRFFGGVPRRIRIDNLKAAVIRAALYDPVLTQIYRECAEHYGFLITVCPPRTPEHKGKVEASIRYVRGHLIRGREYRDIHEANEKALRWILEVASRRVHQTTRQIPLEQFERVEKATLQPLPLQEWEPCEYKVAKLHPDCHVVYQGSYYSAPVRFLGEELLVRATPCTVELYHEHTRVATHRRAWRPGMRLTWMAHYPPGKAQALMATPLFCKEKAQRIGPATTEVVERMFADRPLDRLRGVQAVLSCEKRYGAEALEKASQRALHFGAVDARSIKAILKKGLQSETLPCPEEPVLALPRVFARSARELFSGTHTSERRITP